MVVDEEVVVFGFDEEVVVLGFGGEVVVLGVIVVDEEVVVLGVMLVDEEVVVLGCVGGGEVVVLGCSGELVVLGGGGEVVVLGVVEFNCCVEASVVRVVVVVVDCEVLMSRLSCCKALRKTSRDNIFDSKFFRFFSRECINGLRNRREKYRK